MGKDSDNKFFVCVIFFLELEDLIVWQFRIVELAPLEASRMIFGTVDAFSWAGVILGAAI